MKRLAEPLAGLTGREAAFPNASPEAGSGEFKMESGDRSGFPVGPLPRNSERVLCAFARSGFPVRVRYRFLPSVAPIRKTGATPPIPHTGGARRPAVPLLLLLVPRGGRPADDRHGSESRAGRE